MLSLSCLFLNEETIESDPESSDLWKIEARKMGLLTRQEREDALAVAIKAEGL